jgi:hypothetical protein
MNAPLRGLRELRGEKIEVIGMQGGEERQYKSTPPSYLLSPPSGVESTPARASYLNRITVPPWQ